MSPMNRFCLYYLLFGFLLFANTSLSAQVYLQKQSRHRFAQLNMGLSLHSSVGGHTIRPDARNQPPRVDFSPSLSPKMVIGGTHFWGHADFYVAFPVYTGRFQRDALEATYTSGTETVFKYYPWRIERRKVRPYIGVGLTSFYFEQRQTDRPFGNGPELNHTTVPVYAGLTYRRRNQLLEAGLLWNYRHRRPYYLSRTVQTRVTTPPLYLSVSYRWILETTLSAEPAWESGQTATITQQKAAANQLNNFFVGVGVSSAFWLKKDSYNQAQRPYIERRSTSVMPEFSVGYYWHQPDLHVATAFRRYASSSRTYGVVQRADRRSLALEVVKTLGDYHGFVPFLGPAVSYEWLEFAENFENQPSLGVRQSKWAYGLTFGWDIRPNRIQSWLLRTNLRWWPNLHLDLDDGTSIAFDNIEFNFIQLIVYPGRMFGK